jgi:predicted transposase YbfD/YdcC
LPLNFSRLFPPTAERQRQADLEQAETVNKGHGRREIRRLQTSTRLTGHLDWPGLAQVCRLERTRKCGGRQTTEIAYAVTSVPRHQADATRLLAWWRGHWGIENRVHWPRDVAWGEDRCRIRTGHGPHTLSAIRNAALNFTRSLGQHKITAALRQNALQVNRLLTKLGILKK